MTKFETSIILGVRVSCISMCEVLTLIEDTINNHKNDPILVFPLNVDLLIKAQHDELFRKILNECDLVTADGVPILWAGRMLNKGPKETVSGSDLLPKVCNLAAARGYAVFFLGAGPGVAERASNNLMKEMEGLKVVGVCSPNMDIETDEREQAKAVERVHSAKPDILFVGLGAPKQEKFLWKYRHKLGVPVSIAVGGAFDRVAEKVRRAPIWMQRIGLEWMWRVMQEPKRLWRRYLVDDIPFIWLFVKEYFRIIFTKRRNTYFQL